MRALTSAVLLLLGCKESGPSEAQLAAARRAEQQKLCAQSGPRARWDELVTISKRVKAAPEVRDEQLPTRSLKLRELHFRDGVTANTDVNWLSDFAGPKRGIIGSCVYRQTECRDDDFGLDEALKGCATIDAYVVVRPLLEEKPKPGEIDGKYRGGYLEAEAFVFALPGPDGGAPVQLGALTFAARLTGEVEIYRDYTASQVEYALNEGLRESALRQLEALLGR